MRHGSVDSSGVTKPTAVLVADYVAQRRVQPCDREHMRYVLALPPCLREHLGRCILSIGAIAEAVERSCHDHWIVGAKQVIELERSHTAQLIARDIWFDHIDTVSTAGRRVTFFPSWRPAGGTDDSNPQARVRNVADRCFLPPVRWFASSR